MKVKKLKQDYRKLYGFLSRKNIGTRDIVDWISDCVAFFSTVKVNESIISVFMDSFKEGEVWDGLRGHFGPFAATIVGYYSMKDENSIFKSGNLYGRRVATEIAFRTAKSIILNLEDAERLVPKTLLIYFNENTSYSQIASSLEMMEQNFEKKDAQALAQNSITLLESILDLEQSLVGQDLSNKLRRLCADTTLLDKFGARKEIVHALDNSRLLRNQLTTHKSIPIEYDIPFAVSLGTAYLVIMFLQITMATGILIV